MHARVRRCKEVPSGLVYHVFTPKGLAKHLEEQKTAPDHLQDYFSLDESHRSITDYHPGVGVGPNRPSQTQGIFVADAPEHEDQQRCAAFNGAKSMEDLINSSRPIASIQVTRFSDATLITLSVSHSMGDLLAIKAIFQGWATSLHGKPLRTFGEIDRDPFAAYGPGGHMAPDDILSDSPILPPGWRVYSALDKIRFLSNFMWDVKVAHPEKTVSPKYVFLPEAKMQSLEATAKLDLARLQESRKQQGIASESQPSVSRSNVFYAWLLKHNHADLHPDRMCGPVTVSNLRVKPPTGITAGSDDFPKHPWYDGGSLAALPCMKAGDLMDMPLGELALYIRDGTEVASTPENARRFLSYKLHNYMYTHPTGNMAFWCPPDHHWSGLSDWRQIKFHDFDMTPARLDGTDKKVELNAINCHGMLAASQRYRWICLGEADGGIWLYGVTYGAQWQHPQGFGKYTHLKHQRTSKL
jgi:hypothetical protein